MLIKIEQVKHYMTKDFFQWKALKRVEVVISYGLINDKMHLEKVIDNHLFKRVDPNHREQELMDLEEKGTES